MRRRTVFGVLSGAAAVAVAAPVTFIIETEKAQYRSNAKRAGLVPSVEPDGRTLVVYFSRSGNTALTALEIARDQKARAVNLLAADYRIGFWGWINALKDSQNQQAVIVPATVDLSPYDRIFIGSPIWWYSPAPPAWQFVAANDFSDKEVVLFNTFNSRFKQGYIDRFRAGVEAKGGRFLKHLHVRRGRMTHQIGTEEMLEQMRQQLSAL